MVSNSYCTTFQMNHTPCWAFCESIPVEHICCEKKFLQYHSAVTLTMRNWECWQDKAKKWLDPPLFRQTHPSTSHNRTGEKILKLWHTHWNVFHIPLNTYLANCYAISFCYLDNNISTWGPHKKKTTFWCSVPPQILDSIFLHFLSQDVLQGFVFLHTKYSGKAIHIIIENSISAQKSW